MDRVWRYNFRVEYVPGESIPHVDALSRQEVQEEKISVNMILEEEEGFMRKVSAIS
jgi:hypothetical protein